MRRFFVAPEQITNDHAVLGPDEARHALKALRLSPGDRVELLDGSGTIFDATFDTLSKVGGELTITSRRVAPLPSGGLTIAQALLKGKKMEFLAQKATELGVEALQPLTTERSVPLAESGRNERLHKISIQACKQCGRSRPVHIRPLDSLEHFLASQQADTGLARLFFWEKENVHAIRQAFAAAGEKKRACILVGPEGGFSDREAGRIADAGFLPVGLGQTILRAETAALTAMVLGQLFLGNLQPGEEA